MVFYNSSCTAVHIPVRTPPLTWITQVSALSSPVSIRCVISPYSHDAVVVGRWDVRAITQNVGSALRP
eukprot:SAG22_NODE_731_length_7588_cov_6.237281_1_plen_68_part_00